MTVHAQDQNNAREGYHGQERCQEKFVGAEPVEKPPVVQGAAASALASAPWDEEMVRHRNGKEQDRTQGENGLGKASRDAFVEVGGGQ